MADSGIGWQWFTDFHNLVEAFGFPPTAAGRARAMALPVPFACASLRAEMLGDIAYDPVIGGDVVLLDAGVGPDSFDPIPETEWCLLTHGSAFWRVLDKSEGGASLQWLPFDTVTVNLNSDATRVQDYDVTGVDEKIGLDEMIHIRKPSPLSDVYGLSPVAACLVLLNVEAALSLQLNGIMRRPLPRGAFVSETPHSKTELEKYAAAFEEEFNSPDDAGKIPFLGGGYKFEDMSLAPNQLLADQLFDIIAKRCCAAFQVDPVLIGLRAGNYAERRESRLQMYESVIIREARFLERSFNKGLKAAGVSFKWDTENIPAMLRLKEMHETSGAREVQGEGWVQS